MGKLLISNGGSEKVGTKVMKESSVRKKSCRRTKTRFIKFRHHISVLIDEIESLEEKNHNLINSLNKEKKLNSELQNQVFYWQRLYHEAGVSLNTYKVKTADTLEKVSLLLKDMNLVWPHFLELSKIISQQKVRLKSQLSDLQTLDTENFLPNAYGDCGQLNNDLHKEREPACNNLSPTGESTLFPITEENEQNTVERRRTSEGSGAVSRTYNPKPYGLRPDDDPIEVCSWMDLNIRKSSNKENPDKGKIQSPITSDSSDEESIVDVVMPENVSNSVHNSLCVNSQTFTVPRNTSSSSSSAGKSSEASAFSKIEPDSTSNIVFARASSPSRDSLGLNSTSTSLVYAHEQLAYSDTLSEVFKSQKGQGSCNNNSLTLLHEAPLVATEHVRPSPDQRRSSKRIRKLKSHLYPGEKSNKPKTLACKVKKGKLVIQSSNSRLFNSRLSANRKSHGNSSLKKSLEVQTQRGSSGPSSTAADLHLSQGRPDGSSVKKMAPNNSSLKMSQEVSRGSSGPSSAADDHRPQGRPVRSSLKKMAPKKSSSVKKGFESSRTSAISMDQSSSQVSGERVRRNLRRTTGQISYKESPLKTKK